MMDKNYSKYNKPNNETISFNRNKPKCPRCNGMRYILESRCTQETRDMYHSDVKIDYGIPCPVCNGGHEEAAENARQKSRIPCAYYDKSLSDFNWDVYGVDVSELKTKIEKYINKFGNAENQGIGLYITSKTKGSGKTLLASCVCNELITNYRINTKFVSASELIDIQKYGIHDTSYASEYDNDPIKLLCDCRVLVIDDLGVKKTGQNWNEDILFRIIDTRMNAKRVTILTSNNAINELDLDERIVDRIYKTTVPVRIPEVAVRQTQAISDHKEFWDKL